MARLQHCRQSGERQADGPDRRSARGPWCCARHGSSRSPVPAAPLSSGRRAMRLYMRAVQKNLRGRAAGCSQRYERFLPNPFRSPANEAVVERLGRAIGSRRVLPPAAGLQDMNDTADHSAVIDPRNASRVRRQERLKPAELRLCKPEMLRHRIAPTVWGSESQPRFSGNPVYGS